MIKANMKSILRSKRLSNLILQCIFIPVCFIWVYPFLWMLSSSFKNQKEMFMNGISLIPKMPTLDNIVRAWNAAKFYKYFFNSLIVTISVVVIVLLITSLAGYALGRGNMPGKKYIMFALVATMFLPKGFTILPVFKLINGLGLNNNLMGIILAEAGPAHIVAILLFTGYFSSIPKELEESALMDGASHPRIYAGIMLPLAKPIIATVTIFNFIGSWNAFFIPLVFTLNASHLRTVGVGLYAFYGERAIDWTGLAAGACMAVIPIIIVFLFLQKFFIEGLSGAIKG